MPQVAAPGQLRFHQADMGNKGAMRAAFSANSGRAVDTVIHFAAIAFVGEVCGRRRARVAGAPLSPRFQSYANPLLYYRNVTANTLQLLEVMREFRVSRLVYSSSCATYGNAERMPITESTPQRPVSPYGTSKLQAERLIIDNTVSSVLPCSDAP